MASRTAKKPAHRNATRSTRGRPSIFSDAAAAEICERLAHGETLIAICSDERMPSYSTVLRWRVDNKQFREAYARAREDQAFFWADQIIEISDDSSAIDHLSAKLRVESRKFLAAKFAPRVFGDKVAIEATGLNGGPIETRTTLDVSKLSKEQLAALASIRIAGDHS